MLWELGGHQCLSLSLRRGRMLNPGIHGREIRQDQLGRQCPEDQEAVEKGRVAMRLLRRCAHGPERPLFLVF